MEPFSIHCTTCKARLKVTDASVIGQILACPKCHSMVLVEPPSDPASSTPVVAAAVAQPAVKSTTPDPLPVEPPTTSTPTLSEISLSEPAANEISAAPPRPTQPPLPSPPPLPAPSQAPVDPPTAATPDLVAAAARFALPRDFWLFAGGVTAGVTIGVMIWALLPSSPSPDDRIAEASSQQVSPATPVAKDKPDEAPVTAEAKKDSPEPAERRTEVLKPVADPPAPAEDEAPVEDVAPPAAVAAEDPVEDPAPKDAPQVPRALTVEPEAPDVKDVAEAIDENAPTPNAEPPVADQSTTTAEPAETSLGTTAPQSDELPSQLQGRILKGIAFDKVPLRQFAAFVTDYTGIPVQIDTESLAAAGMRTPTVTIRGTDKALDEVFRTALESLGLMFESRDGVLVIFAPKAN